VLKISDSSALTLPKDYFWVVSCECAEEKSE